MCQSKYAVDPATKRRGVFLAFLGLFTIGLSITGFADGYPWGFAAALSGLGSLAYAGYSISKMRFVEYPEARGNRKSK